VLSAVTTFSACLRRQVVYLVCGCMLSMCVRAWCTCLWDVWLWTPKHPTEKYIRNAHTHRQHTATYQMRRLFGMWLYVVYVCACLMYLSVGCLVVNNQTSHREVHQARTHIDNIQPHTKCVVYLVCGCMLSMCVSAWYTSLWDVWVFTTKHPTDKYIRHAHT